MPVASPSSVLTTQWVGNTPSHTRGEVVRAALGLFSARGYEEVAINDIADAASVGRTALYQYFDGKEQIFVALVSEAGADFCRAVRRLGALSPDAAGFERLHWWVGEWAWIYDKYASVLTRRWKDPESPDEETYGMLRSDAAECIGRLTERIEAFTIDGIGADTAAITILTIMGRYNYWRITRTVPMSDDLLLQNLAVALQLFLFPHTPPQSLEVTS